MNRKEAVELLPFIQAFAEGRTVEFKDKRFKDEWDEMSEFPNFSFKSFEFRIKPKLKYRPFKNAEECWQEMQKHQPFGWTKLKGESEYSFITDVNDNINYSDAIRDYTFADDTPFGIKVEE